MEVTMAKSNLEQANEEIKISKLQICTIKRTKSNRIDYSNATLEYLSNDTQRRQTPPIETTAAGDYGISEDISLQMRGDNMLQQRRTLEREHVKLLQEKLRTLENRYATLYFEHEKANIDLEHERHKVGQLERKLKFIKTNQSVLHKLNNVLDIKNEQTPDPRKLVEIRDKSIQTWDTIMCRFCRETEKIRSAAERAKAYYDRNDLVVLTKDQWSNINKTLSTIKSMVYPSKNRDFPLEHMTCKTRQKEFQEILGPEFELAEKRIAWHSSCSSRFGSSSDL